MSTEPLERPLSGPAVGSRGRSAPVVVAVAAFLLLTAAASAAASGVFYLAVRPGMCLIAPSTAGSRGHKDVTVVPCKNPRHNFEVFSVQRGGWGKAPAPANAGTIVLRVCRGAYAHVTGHALRAPGGVYGFWPDRGAEQARYADKVVCSYIDYPSLAPLGSGRHVR